MSQTLFKETICRVLDKEIFDDPIVICNVEHRFLAAEQLRELGVASQVILEPFGKSTAPAVALAALAAVKRSSPRGKLLLVLPADHQILDEHALKLAIKHAGKLAMKGKLVTFGISARTPETGYGYLQKGTPISEDGFEVKKFIEKPNIKDAENYALDENFFWNSGMFVFSADTYLSELTCFAPEMVSVCREVFESLEQTEDFQRISADIFEGCPSGSIDYTIMEKTDRAAMVSLDAGWSDLGSWNALWEVQKKDKNNNAAIGDVVLENVCGSYVQSNSRLVSVVGLENIIIVETADAVLVADKSNDQAVKNIVDVLSSKGRNEVRAGQKETRPWGSFETLFSGKGYKVKRIEVMPGGALSLQSHKYRAEHWTVLGGSAWIECGSNKFSLEHNESTFIPRGSRHRLSNNVDELLTVIEVQVGDYLEEDDIERFEDAYGRV
jgi:mannose-1-phosphate guanylyltransferase/mannose-6-phosphate isomerase